MSDGSPTSDLFDAIKLGIESYRRPGVGRDIDVYAHALLALERLQEQLHTVQGQADTLERQRDEAQKDALYIKEQLEALHEAAEKLRHYFDPSEIRWMSVEDSFIDVPARAVAEIGRALGSNPAPKIT